MNVDAIIDGILERKEQVGMTNQQIADASGVPRTTINRILAKQTQNPSIKTVADIAMAVGYDIDPVHPAVLQDHTKDSYITYLQEPWRRKRKLPISALQSSGRITTCCSRRKTDGSCTCFLRLSFLPVS